MTTQQIFWNNKTKIFLVVNKDSTDILEWEIEPTNFDLIPETDGLYIVSAIEVPTDETINCFLIISTPERIAETIIKQVDGKIISESVYDQISTFIPAAASSCFGDYQLYYAKENPEIGINILQSALTKHPTESTIAEDLGYILRDENRFQEALDAFLHAEQIGVSSAYINMEISSLYNLLGNAANE